MSAFGSHDLPTPATSPACDPPMVVTGASSGIGAATAMMLRQRGHQVLGVDLHGSDIEADLATPEGRREVVARLESAAPAGISALVPCAGIAGLTGTDAARLVSVNYFGAVDLVTALGPALRRGARRAGGSAVVLLSSNSITCQPGWDSQVAHTLLAGDETAARTAASQVEAVQCYPATKAALTLWLRRECVAWARDGVRLNAVAPGLIMTPMTQALRGDAVLGAFADSYPSALERPGLPEEVAEAICFLLSPAASLIVGSVLYVDGGTDALLHPTPRLSADAPMS